MQKKILSYPLGEEGASIINKMTPRQSSLSLSISLSLLASFGAAPGAQAADVSISGPEQTYIPGLFTSADNVFIGNTASGSLLINGGNSAAAKDLYLGSGLGGDGTLTLSARGPASAS